MFVYTPMFFVWSGSFVFQGSIIGRTAKKSGHDDPVWKDNDFLEHGIKLKLGKELEPKFSEQIKSDTQVSREI